MDIEISLFEPCCKCQGSGEVYDEEKNAYRQCRDCIKGESLTELGQDVLKLIKQVLGGRT